MHTYIALLRGINVGGKNKLPMKTLIALLEALGAQAVQTYIQSGNAIFRHRMDDAAALSKLVSHKIKDSQGFEPSVLLLSPERLMQAIASNPFPQAETEPKTLHIYFLRSEPANPNLEKIEAQKAKGESFELKAHFFYLHAPDGIGRSKLAANAEKLIGVPATARNWRTVIKLLELVQSM